MKLSIVTPCYNEEGNVLELHEAILRAVSECEGVDDFEHIFIDNASTDATVALVKTLCAKDPRVKLIVNNRNFGHVRSPYHGLLQATGDAVVCMASDFQDPPTLIPEMVRAWRSGVEIVICVKQASNEGPLMWLFRTTYYRLVSKLSDIDLAKNFTGFGLYDAVVIRTLRSLHDPYPYFRGLIADLGFSTTKIAFDQPRRRRGITKNNFYTLYDVAMLGITNHSKVPLRLATMTGFLLGGLSFLVAMGYLVAKLVWWDSFELGTAPLIISVFFFSAVQLVFIGIVGEYVGAIHTQVQGRPLVIERERVNFETSPTAESTTPPPAAVARTGLVERGGSTAAKGDHPGVPG